MERSRFGVASYFVDKSLRARLTNMRRRESLPVLSKRQIATSTTAGRRGHHTKNGRVPSPYPSSHHSDLLEEEKLVLPSVASSSSSSAAMTSSSKTRLHACTSNDSYAALKHLNLNSGKDEETSKPEHHQKMGKRNSLTIVMNKHVRMMSMRTLKDRLFKKDSALLSTTNASSSPSQPKLLPSESTSPANSSGSLCSLQIQPEEQMPAMRRSLSGELSLAATAADETSSTGSASVASPETGKFAAGKRFNASTGGGGAKKPLSFSSSKLPFKSGGVEFQSATDGIGVKGKRNSLMSKLARTQRKQQQQSSGSMKNHAQPNKALIQCGTLRDILDSPSALTLFLEFLKSEFSEENLNFWLKVEDFRKSKCAGGGGGGGGREEPANRKRAAHEIFNTFIRKEAIFEVNISSSVRGRIETELAEARPGLFDEAQDSVFKLMETDSFKRFKRSMIDA